MNMDCEESGAVTHSEYTAKRDAQPTPEVPEPELDWAKLVAVPAISAEASATARPSTALGRRRSTQ